MTAALLRDAWLLPTLERLLPDEAAARLAAAADGSYWETALRLGLVGDDQLVAAVAARFRMGVADLSTLNPHAREAVPEALARRYRVLPLAMTDAALDVATSDPTDVDCERALAFASGRMVRLLVASPRRIAARLDTLYAAESAEIVIGRILDAAADRYEVYAVTSESEDPDAARLADAGSDRPVVKLVDYLIAEGIASRASDIHVEPDEAAVAVRYRIDGVLRQVLALPRAVGVPLVSRVKIISGLDIADRLRPQDGRARVVVNGRAVDLRVSTLPAGHGEKVVVRILDGGGTPALDEMGLAAGDLERLQRLLRIREGIVLVTGPTGSGKTTTLYAALRAIQQRGGVNVVTVEDPVEYRLPGVVQVQVNERAGLTFAAALRSILRQDPDVVLVGEIRDRETASTAVQASLTGHLVFSTLHTLDAVTSVTRLVDVGVESYKIGAALKGVVAQRLLRRLCRACARPAAGPTPPGLRPWLPPDAAHLEAVGCAECHRTGYRGRVPAMELLVVDAAVERLVSAGAPTGVIAGAARAGGMRSLWESGVRHVLDGATSVDELRRVLDMPAAPPDSRDASATSPRHGSVARRATPGEIAAMTELRVGVVDVFVVRPLPDGWRVLALRRAAGVRCPGAWEVVHGSIEPGERPADAALREVREETGLAVERLYNVTAHPFYLHRTDVVQLALVFTAFVAGHDVTLGDEHDVHAWLTLDEAQERLFWPRERSTLRDAHALLGGGDAGPAEDVLRVV